jgi:hypothetical protein
MDKKDIQSILQEALENEIPPNGINLWNAVKTNLVVGGYQQGKNLNRTKPRYVSRVALATVIAIALLTFAFTTPQGRAWAQELVRFFTRINSTTVQLSDQQLKQLNEINKPYDLPLVPVFIPTVSPKMAAISGCETPQKSQSYRCQVALAESQLGFDLKELPKKSDSWEFKSLYVNTDLHVAVTSYELDFRDFGTISYNGHAYTSHSTLVFTQGVGELSKSNWFGNSPWEVVPTEEVEPISIGTYKGEYVKGDFSLKPGDSVLVWSEADRRQRLAWNEGERWYLIDFSPNLNIANTMGKDQLIRLAESLVYSPIEKTELLNPDRLLSVSDAKKVSGLDLKAPTLLPMDIDFSYARYLPDEQQAQLIYGVNEELTIHEWKGGPVDYKKPLGAYEFTCKMANMNGDESFYCSRENPNPRSFLWWHKNGLNYQMYFDSLTGERIDREQMLLIAESMGAIDDFQKNGPKNYEQIPMYAQALGINAKTFSETPAGWVFSNFWTDAYAGCIDLIYASTTGQGTLSINQCKTDKGPNTSAFPFWSIQQVKVGNAKGRYISGGFVITDDGKQVWDPTLPPKQLYWQEDGLWMQIALYGDAALRSDASDLISYAESLR